MDPVFQNILRTASDAGASDIHLKAGSPIVFRIDRQLRPTDSEAPSDAWLRAILEGIAPAHLREAFAAGHEIDFAFAVDGLGRFRTNAFQQRGQIALALRLVKSQIRDFVQLNLPDTVRRIAESPRGIVIVAGAIGSGKSTTLAAMIDHRNAAASGHIITVEDPIDFLFRHKRSIVNQRELGTDFKAYHVALKNVLRQAPDVIFIGEIRDRETMGMAIAYAQTGHLCLSTLHANNSYHALNRIISFYPLDLRTALLQDLSSSLKCICSQRLIKSVDGGRAPAVEVLLNTRHITELIEEGKINEVRVAIEKSLSPGSQTFEFALYRLFREGRITQEEALQSADSPTNLLWLINNSVTDEEQAANKSKGSEKSAGGVSSKLMKAQEASFKDFQISLNE